ncbi:hypothetical protein [Segniliparus rugosus]|uniref:Uncharacterized protein n=1 Tax=Segniliparus rugosus (strain ATCC BAA-974 / DSM 45345 / CCUG 50838 / CIP 108380 / JCM 13579 / CDC 945) TaxID=679197 RepID=E5XM96_SEGRC|nr:hypothetical protein [Segniliparus rugosus]EFV14522.1 hypothetical protein HMPREF9336_00616 [Segniliparus rugosus ATCC BAA-974]
MRGKLKIVFGLVALAALALTAALYTQLASGVSPVPRRPETVAAGPAGPPEETIVLRLETLSQVGRFGLVMLLGDGTVVRQDAGSPTGYTVAALPQPAFDNAVTAVREELAKGLDYQDVLVTDVPSEAIRVRDGDRIVSLSVDWLDNSDYDNGARRALRAVLAQAQGLIAKNAGPSAPYLRQPVATLSYSSLLEREGAKPWPLPRPLRPAELRGSSYGSVLCTPLDDGDLPSGPQFAGTVEPEISTEPVRVAPPPVRLTIAATLPGERACGGGESPGAVPGDPDPAPAVWEPLGPVDEAKPAELVAALNLGLDLQAAKKADGSVLSSSRASYRMARVGNRWYLDCSLRAMGAGRPGSSGNWLARSDPRTGEILRFDQVG